jgi:large subunit ribosomal protein L29
MKMKELTTKNEAELKKDLENLRQEAADLRTKMRLGQQKNTSQLKDVRKTIARILTILAAK